MPLGIETRQTGNGTGIGPSASGLATCLPTGSGNRLHEVAPEPVPSPGIAPDTEETGFGPGYEHPFCMKPGIGNGDHPNTERDVCIGG